MQNKQDKLHGLAERVATSGTNFTKANTFLLADINFFQSWKQNSIELCPWRSRPRRSPPSRSLGRSLARPWRPRGAARTWSAGGPACGAASAADAQGGAAIGRLINRWDFFIARSQEGTYSSARVCVLMLDQLTYPMSYKAYLAYPYWATPLVG